MKPFLVLSALILIILSASVASAQCQHSTDACVTSISLSASAIPGDQFTETVATGRAATLKKGFRWSVTRPSTGKATAVSSSTTGMAAPTC